MTDKKVTCYTCRFCKMYSHGGIYCALREKGGQCIGFDSWESQEDVLDKARAEIVEEMLSHSGTGEEVIQAYADGLKKGLDILDKYKAESEPQEKGR